MAPATAAAGDTRFRLMCAMYTRLAPLIHLAQWLSRPPRGDRAGGGGGREVDAPMAVRRTIPRRWYISHVFFWIGSGTACWYQFRRLDRADARRHLLRSIWMPPLVWLVFLVALGLSIPDDVLADMVRNAPYARAP